MKKNLNENLGEEKMKKKSGSHFWLCALDVLFAANNNESTVNYADGAAPKFSTLRLFKDSFTTLV